MTAMDEPATSPHVSGAARPPGRVGLGRLGLDPRSAFWRRLAHAGATRGPGFWVRYSPPLFGLVFGALMPRQRRRIRDNLRLLLGPRAAAREFFDVARTFSQYAHVLAESLGAARPEGARAVGQIVGAEHMREAIKCQRGVILLTAHTGGWDLAASALKANWSLDVALVMASERNVDARHLHDEVRQRHGVRIFHVGGHPTDSLRLLKHLRRRGAVAIQLDRVPRGTPHLRVAVHDRSFEVPRGPFQLASMVGAPLVPVFMWRRGYFDYVIEAFAAVEVPSHADEATLQRCAATAAEAMVGFLKRHPTQWFNFSL